MKRFTTLFSIALVMGMFISIASAEAQNDADFEEMFIQGFATHVNYGWMNSEPPLRWLDMEQPNESEPWIWEIEVTLRPGLLNVGGFQVGSDKTDLTQIDWVNAVEWRQDILINTDYVIGLGNPEGWANPGDFDIDGPYQTESEHI